MVINTPFNTGSDTLGSDASTRPLTTQGCYTV